MSFNNHIPTRIFIIISIPIISIISIPDVGVFADGIQNQLSRDEWSIGVFTGSTIFNLSQPPGIKNPIITPDDVYDIKASGVADPFFIRDNGIWYMFFEIIDRTNDKGCIGLSESNDGLHWNYRQIVLDETFHLSYPYVFKFQNEYYMIPSSSDAPCLYLYKAEDFPTNWNIADTLLNGSYQDASILQYDDKWWLFTETDSKNGILHLYYADDLFGPWEKHPESPVVNGDKDRSRPGGRILIDNGQLLRFAQDDYPTYGNAIRVFEIVNLTTESYNEIELFSQPIFQGSGTGWNSVGMHNIDIVQADEDYYIACVDGRKRIWIWDPLF